MGEAIAQRDCMESVLSAAKVKPKLREDISNRVQLLWGQYQESKNQESIL